MATIEIVKMSDDLDPRIKNGVETVKFFDPITGDAREIELGEKNREHFANHLAKLEKYLTASRVVETVVPAKPKAAKSDKGELALIREWAKANGYTVGDRGRIKADIVDAYHKAQEAVSNPDTDAQASGDEPVELSEDAPETEDLGYAWDGSKIIPCPDGKPGCEVMHTELSDEDQANVDALLDEATGNVVTQSEIDEMLAEFDTDGENE